MSYRFNPPPGWPAPPEGWAPPADWQPDASWPAPPADWQFWVEESAVPSYDPTQGAASYDPAAGAAPSYDPNGAASSYDPAAGSYDPAAGAAPSYDPNAAGAYPTSSYAAAPAPFSSDPVMQPFQSDPSAFAPGGYAPGVPGAPGGPAKKSRGGLIAVIAGGIVVIVLAAIGISVLAGGDDEADPTPSSSTTTDEPTDDPTTRDPDPTDDPTDDPTTANPTNGGTAPDGFINPIGNGNVPVDMPGYELFTAESWEAFLDDPESLAGQKYVMFSYIWNIDDEPLRLTGYTSPQMLTSPYEGSDNDVVFEGDASVIGGVQYDDVVQVGVEVIGVVADGYDAGAPLVRADVLAEPGLADLAGDLGIGAPEDQGYGSWILPFTFTNTGLTEADFMFEISIESADGARQYDTTYASFTSIRPGQTASDDSYLSEELPDGAVFRVISARRS